VVSQSVYPGVYTSFPGICYTVSLSCQLCVHILSCEWLVKRAVMLFVHILSSKYCPVMYPHIIMSVVKSFL